ncbi:MAG: Uma2 family endonuclease [Prochlorotrichaceae cyanobacterium]|jgi:Uma2 family endonuclease
MTLAYPSRRLPTAAELPGSDETPVDNQLQDDIPQLLKAVLQRIWDDRSDWFFAVDMGIYYHPDRPAIVPDAFLSIGVPRFKGVNGRLSYVLWEEENIVPIFALEVVSQTYNGEYETKLEDYQDLGILYYGIYNIKAGTGRKFAQRSSLEVYKQVNGVYQRQAGNPVWMPEIGLGLGCETNSYGGWEREWLYWYTQDGDRYVSDRELRQQEREQRILSQWETAQERQRRFMAEQETEEERQRRFMAEQETEEERERGLRAEQEVIQEREARLQAEQRLQELENRLKALGLEE